MVKISKNEKEGERRKAKRHPCSELIFFVTEGQFYEGQCKDISRSGLFIQTSEFFSVGEVITVAMPFSDRKDDKRKAQIIWRNKEGFGAELFGNRNEAEPDIERIEKRIGNSSK